MATGVWVWGLITVIVQCIWNNTPIYFFHPAAISSGIIWSIGNILTVPIIKTIGMALGMSIWCATQLIVGWSTGKWGLLGTPKDTSVKNEPLNYIGVGLVFVSLILFFNVKPDNIDDDNKKHDKEYYRSGDNDEQHLHIPRTKAHVFNANMNNNNNNNNHSANNMDNENSIHTINSQRRVLIENTSQSDLKLDRQIEMEMVESWVDKLSQTQKNIVGVVCSVIAGICYGVMFCPVQSLTKKGGDFSKNMIDYVFVTYNGIFLSALFYFVVYNLSKRNKPQINHSAVFPSIIGGIIWAFAMDSYFFALDPDYLGVDTTFPIVSAGPQIVSSLWGVLYYKEIRGQKNILFLTAAICCSLLSVGFVTLSKFVK